jgi:hypothetical protein
MIQMTSTGDGSGADTYDRGNILVMEGVEWGGETIWQELEEKRLTIKERNVFCRSRVG